MADKFNHTIRKVTPTGAVTTLAGAAGVTGFTDGTGNAARFNQPVAIAVDGSGNLYVVDNGSAIRKVTAAGVVTTLAGSTTAGAADGPGTAARFNFPRGIAVDTAGNVYVADSGNNTVRKVTAAGVVTTLAGTAGIATETDGNGAAARFNFPSGIAVDGTGVVYVTDFFGGTIRRIDTSNNVTTVAGVADSLTGVRLGALPGHFALPVGPAIDSIGRLYVTDANALLLVTLR